MVSAIQRLPTEVVHLIAAGEVIDSLAAVVRELVENSLDAGATRINVSVWPEQWRVRVADNGCGMDLVDLMQAAAAHTTSKIRKSEDLWKITSLGFRGEALHSLAQLSELEILSRPNPARMGEGWRVTYDSQGEPLQVTDAAIAPGTVVCVSNLFGNWPTQRQGMPSPTQQLKAIQSAIQQISLCHPHVTWQIQQNDRLWLSLCPGTTAQQILPQILKEVRPSDLHQLTLEVPTPGNEADNTHSSLHLVIGLPDRCHRRRLDWVRVAMNGRMVKCPELEQTIVGGFSRTLPRDRYPVCFVHLQICPSQINWNRHPAKSEVYLHQLSYWQEQVAQAIEQALRFSPATLPATVHSQRVSKLIKTAEAKGGYDANRSIQPPPESDKQAKISGDIGLMQLQAVAQVNKTYIVAEHPAGLWLVEQHIAHERVLYEQLCDRWQLVPLEPPIILQHLSPTQLRQLEHISLEVEPFGEHLWAVRTAPALLQQRNDCAEALLELSWGGDLNAAQVATACRSAIRNGTPLTLSEMQTLLEQWQRTHSPRTCPHGRPIYLSLEESALSRFFRRHWVIGKSHGI